MKPRRLITAQIALAAAVAGIWLGCGSKSTPSGLAGDDCHESPMACSAGTTCWPAAVSNGVPQFRCLASVQGTGLLAPCEDSVGTATCADCMTCDAITHDGQGACTFYCDDGANPCPVSYTCAPVTVGDSDGAPTINICRKNPSVPNQPVDGGVTPTFPTDAAFDSKPNVQT